MSQLGAKKSYFQNIENEMCVSPEDAFFFFLNSQKSDSTEVKKARPDHSKEMPSGKIDSDQRDEIKRLYKLEMPEDFYHFWDFCKELNPESPCGKAFMSQCIQLTNA